MLISSLTETFRSKPMCRLLSDVLRLSFTTALTIATASSCARTVMCLNRNTMLLWNNDECIAYINSDTA